MSQELSTRLDPTAGQLERDISQKVRALYRDRFGHQPSRVDCHLVNNKFVLFLEDVTTPLEKLLVETDSHNLVIQVREFVDEALKPKLKELVEEISQVKVINCLYNTQIEADSAGAILVLDRPPRIRRSRSFGKKQNSSGRSR